MARRLPLAAIQVGTPLATSGPRRALKAPPPQRLTRGPQRTSGSQGPVPASVHAFMCACVTHVARFLLDCAVRLHMCAGSSSWAVAHWTVDVATPWRSPSRAQGPPGLTSRASQVFKCYHEVGPNLHDHVSMGVRVKSVMHKQTGWTQKSVRNRRTPHALPIHPTCSA